MWHVQVVAAVHTDHVDKTGTLTTTQERRPPAWNRFYHLLFSLFPPFFFSSSFFLLFLLPRVREPPGCSPAVLYDVVKSRPHPARPSIRSPILQPAPICRVRAYGDPEISRFAYTRLEFTRRRQRRASFDDRRSPRLALTRLTRFSHLRPIADTLSRLNTARRWR